MTDTSPTRPLEVDASRPLEPAAVALLQSVGAACAQLDAAFVVAGATARDILMWHVHGIRPVRATRDVDVAVCAVSWPFHARLVDTLVATGQFARAPKHQQKLLFDSGMQGFRTELDLVPFGPLEAPPGEIAWPPGGDFVLNVLGFQEAVDTALTVSIGAGITVPVASLPALALLKLLAWKDRRARQNSDAYDLLFLLTHFHDAGNRERIWDVAPDLLERHGFQPELAAAALLARDAKRAASPHTYDAIRALLSDDATYATLAQDLQARAFALLPGEFNDDADRYLDAFRGGFLADPPVRRA
ncbi:MULTISPECIES: nucleotidyl transferase AbiEii/AbiGii toxin family protein [unclassified Burkholderia]|uniref:nucleotidyl transferase AbiEii/AbiGii toxin family protein n=1 Tax=unclassified Burkholderia TaxID=2613784 RepID=UPI00075F16D0|nr:MULTISPECIES: nucleotidyl transferase AbiEii/AbiGii toxin family protein [unclassified Burkholderia]AOI78622.1 nucleotidyltransferase [Burkholderia sp. NRF60-BP8]KVA05573.1 nucleotidyltransferase [Burkholderia sp. NRF60-BP8]KVL11444.1 nucleotidyltransferase [Burkholderia sp. MSMB1826]